MTTMMEGVEQSEVPASSETRVQAKEKEPEQEPEKQTADAPDDGFIVEGQAKVAVTSEVFYNHVQEFNRDLSVAVITTWLKYDPKTAGEEPKDTNPAYKKSQEAKRGTILEALAATGLRSLRYAKEIPGVGLITTNDMEAAAVEAIKSNRNLNGLTEQQLTVSKADANQVMYQALLQNKPYSIIDLDPFGTASPFIDAAVQAVASGGLLCITCTDLAVLCGNHPEVAFEKYGGISVPGTPYCHETALRLVLHCVQTSASRYKRCIVPLLSMSIDFYVRIFVAVYNSPLQTKFAASNTMMLYSCTGCKSFETQSLCKTTTRPNGTKFGAAIGPTAPQKCSHCDSSFHVGGPMYAGRLHDTPFVKQLLDYIKKDGEKKFKTHVRMNGMLTVVSEELLDQPFYYEIPRLSSCLNTSTPPLNTVCSAILNAGYQVSISHALKASVKTNAPPRIIWDIMRSFVKQHPIKTPKEGSLAAKILATEPSVEINFARHPDAEPPSRKIKMVRFEVPAPNSGPKSRPGKRKAPEQEQRNKKSKSAVEEPDAETAADEQN
ncbi:hypothetical protein SmJEL517_g00413 [Synchytrium microbalum]|uniref:tRNA (guanine(26)-N(2))-dimethyltransferase n=1 Tax=Synchytrium microbalum TaxID=1806994 RepID=A0A507CJ52_9FUNG|nr:uncharacterized protein SmJEL517_g00413 [Synchytrium microbalum]TPX38214.1 hypothetical protein SmJEL517_g00413 [Synchytrium microbalum]